MFETHNFIDCCIQKLKYILRTKYMLGRSLKRMLSLADKKQKTKYGCALAVFILLKHFVHNVSLCIMTA